MSKVSQILPAFVFAFIIISAVSSEECLSKTKTWGIVGNPNAFYYCDPTTNTAEIADCEEGKGYVNNGTSLGCIPWMEWSDDCVSKTDPSTIICDDSQRQPLAWINPGVFYLCTSAGAAPVAVKCQPGTGFYNRNGYLGCIPYEMWRTITGCVNVNP